MPTDKIESAEAFVARIHRMYLDLGVEDVKAERLALVRERDLRVVRAVLDHIDKCDDPSCSDSAAVILRAITEGEPDAER